MSHENTERPMKLDRSADSAKREYTPPQLTYYGAIRDLTQNANGSLVETVSQNCATAPKAPIMFCAGSERRFKEHIVRVGTHPLGIGLYLFNYRSEYCALWGHSRQLGVMIDEIERVMPEAICAHPDGHKMVNYSMLGIDRSVH